MLFAREVLKPEIGPRGETRLVCVLVLELTDESIALAQLKTYCCEHCDVAVMPVFVEKHKAGRKRSPRSYFRAINEKHTAECRPEHAIAMANASRTMEGRSHRLTAPARFVDEPVPRRLVALANGPLASDLQENPNRPRGSRIRDGGPRASASTVSELRALVAPWHSDPVLLANKPLRIPGFPGRTYRDAFRRIDGSLASCLPPTPFRFIFWFTGFAITEKTSGYDIRFGIRTPDNRYLAAYVLRSIGGKSLPKETNDRLLAAMRGESMTLYVLGAFELSGTNRSFILEPATVRHLWLEPGTPGASADE